MRVTGSTRQGEKAKLLGRRPVLASIAVVTLGAGLARTRPGSAQASVVADVERYLNRIDTLEARFSQIAPNGGLATGKVYIHRPGRLRFDYDPPSRIRLIAPGDWRLIFYDASIKQVNVIPIRQTPLGILLDRRISLENGVEVVGVERAGDEVAVTLVRDGADDQGSVTLVFGEQPLALRRWTVVDPQGLVTHILLEEVATGGNIDPELFRWRDPAIFGLPD
jgi:outer membrane lipoprotein-sorting protein